MFLVLSSGFPSYGYAMIRYLNPLYLESPRAVNQMHGDEKALITVRDGTETRSRKRNDRTI
jgi:hypothetical protein